MSELFPTEEPLTGKDIRHVRQGLLNAAVSGRVTSGVDQRSPVLHDAPAGRLDPSLVVLYALVVGGAVVVQADHSVLGRSVVFAGAVAENRAQSARVVLDRRHCLDKSAAIEVTTGLIGGCGEEANTLTPTGNWPLLLYPRTWVHRWLGEGKGLALAERLPATPDTRVRADFALGTIVVDASERLHGDALLAFERLFEGNRDQTETDLDRRSVVAEEELRKVLLRVLR